MSNIKCEEFIRSGVALVIIFIVIERGGAR